MDEISLLLSSSSIFEDHSQYDCLHQSIIDLNNENSKEDVHELLIKAQKYLEKDIDINLAKDIFSLIIKCYSCFPKDFIPTFVDLMKMSRTNSYYIVIISSVLSYYIQNDYSDYFSEYHKFIFDSLNEIIIQIQNLDKPQLIIFQNEIPPAFKLNLLLNLTISSDLKEENCSNMIKYLFLPKNIEFLLFNKNELSFLVHKIIKSGLIDIIIPLLPDDLQFYSIVNIEDLTVIIQLISNQVFIKIFPQIEEIFLKSTQLNLLFIETLFKKCDELNIQLKSFEKVFKILTPKEITPQIINYSKKYDFYLPHRIAIKYNDYPDNQFVQKIFPKDLIYEEIYHSSLDVTSSEFYIHAFTTLVQNKDKITDRLIKNIVNLFQNHIKMENFIEIIDEIIYSVFSSNQEMIDILNKFIDMLDNIYKESYYQNNHINKLINSILEMKNILPYSFMHLIDRHSAFRAITKLILLNQDENIRLYYIYKFSNKKENDVFRYFFIEKDFEYQLKFKVFLPKSGFSIQLKNFIKEKDLNLLSSIDEETLEFILKALIFGEVNKTIISGLTKEIILPFYAIAMQNWEKGIEHYNTHIFDDEQNKNLFLETLKSMMNNQSIIIVESINSILNSFEKGKLVNNFLDIKYKVMEILIESFLMKKYNQNKTFITSYLTSNIDCLKYVKSNLNDLINYFTKEKDLESILFIEKIQSRYDYLKEKHLIKIPLEYFDGKALKDFFPILEYKLSNENNFSINDFIFNKLINNKLLRKCYLITRLQSYDNNNSITIDNLYTHAKNDYSDHTDSFVEVFNSVYMYNSTKYDFVKKSSFNDDNFKSEFEIGRNIIDYFFHLIEQNKMKNKAFYCLKNIACSFLFLFDQNPNQIFEVVLPELENYLIIFDDKIGNGNKEIKEKAKTAICALSFLISSLHSNKVIDAFINWYFTNNEKFSDIQNYCFNYLFLLTLKTNGLKRTIIASLMKYDYNEIILKLMKKDIENEIFRINYNKLFYLILCELAISFNKFDEFDILAMDELKKMNSPFCFDFNNYITFLPLTIKQMMPEEILSNVPQTKLQQELFDFMKNIECIKYFWLNYKNEIKKDNFFSKTYNAFYINTHYRRIDLNKDLELKDPISITFGRYIFQKSSWLYQCFTKNQNISLYQDEFDIFIQVLDELNKYQNDSRITEIDKRSSFQKYRWENYIFDISNLASLSDKDFPYICKLIANIIKTKEDKLSSLNTLAKSFDIIYENDIKEEKRFNYFSRFLSVLLEISNLDDFKQNFNDIFEKSLFSIVLQPEHRITEEILSKLADILINIDLPDVLFCYEHAFDFMFLTQNDDIIYKATKLSSKYMNHLIPKYNQKIRKCFSSLIKKTPLSLSKIIELIKIDSSLADFYMNTILLDKLFNINLSINPNKSLIIQLINLLTPNITNYDENIFTDNNELEINQNPPIPLSLLDINPIFWNYFIENRNKINKVIEDNNLTYFNDNYVIDGDNSMISLKLFDDYPQLFSFAFKRKLFYEKINKEVHFDQTLNLLIDTENIVESSFDQLHLLDAENWKKNIEIQNIGENGVDMGGLRRSWFTKLSRALFNTDFGLFSLTENMTFQPSIKSYSNSNYLQLFKFTGAFIARAILQKEHIDVELSHSFLSIILDYKIDIEDIREIDESVYNSLKFILNNDLNEYEGYELYFEIDHDNFGKLETFEFIENGSQVRVTNENKLVYVQYVVNYYLFNSIECQLQKFFEGFDSLINFRYINIFSPRELGLLISGRSEINVDKIKESAIYEHPYTYDSPPVVLFFNSIEKWNQSDLAALMMFITGCPKAPADGSVSINIQCGGDKSRYPGARTCFNILFLPQYENEEELNSKFRFALREETFSLQ